MAPKRLKITQIGPAVGWPRAKRPPAGKGPGCPAVTSRMSPSCRLMAAQSSRVTPSGFVQIEAQGPAARLSLKLDVDQLHALSAAQGFGQPANRPRMPVAASGLRFNLAMPARPPVFSFHFPARLAIFSPNKNKNGQTARFHVQLIMDDRHVYQSIKPRPAENPPCNRPTLIGMTKTDLKWSGQRDSNSRHQAWEACTLPTELCPLTNCSSSLISVISGTPEFGPGKAPGFFSDAAGHLQW
jgi:hypothetical protein